MTFVVGFHHITSTPVSQCLYICARTKRNSSAQVVYLACCAADAAVAMTASTRLAHVTVFTNFAVY